MNKKKTKITLIRKGRKLNGSDIYVNEHLTKKIKNADISRKARFLRKQKKNPINVDSKSQGVHETKRVTRRG